jgi:hypothetical protein
MLYMYGGYETMGYSSDFGFALTFLPLLVFKLVVHISSTDWRRGP